MSKSCILVKIMNIFHNPFISQVFEAIEFEEKSKIVQLKDENNTLHIQWCQLESLRLLFYEA